MKIPPVVTHQRFILSLYQCIYSKSYSRAEIYVLIFIAEVLKHSRYNHEQMEEDRNAVEIIYNRFNESYEKWIGMQGKDLDKEYMKHKNEDHKNYFIAHCFDAWSMNNLLLGLKIYLSKPSPELKKDLRNQYEAYKKMWQ